MRINEWFNIKDVEHIKAYHHSQNRGIWPKGFLPDNIVFDQGWQIVLMHKFAIAYIDEKLEFLILYRDGEPCVHPGCLRRTVTTPCEVCGRFRAQGEILEDES